MERVVLMKKQERSRRTVKEREGVIFECGTNTHRLKNGMGACSASHEKDSPQDPRNKETTAPENVVNGQDEKHGQHVIDADVAADTGSTQEHFDF